MKSTMQFGRKALILALAWSLGPGAASANPDNAAVIRGRADIVGRGNTLTITNTPGTIINWGSFSIRPGEVTRFVQQDAASAVLNRIVGQDPSQIFGALESNGRVFLINPNGILFGATARVDVNGLVASTLHLGNEDFLAGGRNFTSTGTPGSIRNQGTITTPSGGQVYLIAPNVENSGLIRSPQGDVLLASGRQVQLADSTNPALHVVVSAPEDQSINLGSIVAQGGRVGIFGALVNQRGIINADSAVAGENGAIVLRSSRQTLLEDGSVTSARGAGTGGDIRILGEHVGLTGDARVDASGDTGGGTVLVGGDYRGGNAAVPNATATFVGAQATINADALSHGDGGRIIVWANDATRMYGNLSARGGAQSGNGGFAEVSGRNYLDFRGRADLRAVHGSFGSLLLDPNDLTIQNGPAPATDVGLSAGVPWTFSGGPASSILTVADLQAQLGMGSVIVSTSAGAGGPRGGRITVADAIAWNGGQALTLSADNGIAINGAITALADGTLLLDSRGGGITQTAPIRVTYVGITSIGDVTLTNAGNQVTNLAAHVGDATHRNGNFSFVNSQTLNVHDVRGISGIAVDVDGGPGGIVSLRTTAGDITQSSTSLISATGLSVQASNVFLDAANPTAAISGQAAGTFAYTGAGGITATHIGGSDVSLNASAGSINGSVNAGSLAAIATNGISLTTQVASLSAVNTGGAADIAISNTGAVQLIGVSQNGSGAVLIDSTGPLTVPAADGVLSTSGAISLTAAGALNVTGNIASSAGGAIMLQAGPTGAVTDQLSIGGTVSTSGNVLLRAGDAINVTGTVTGTVTQQAFLNVPVLPTLAVCIANPTLPGCAAVLPGLATCISNSATPGCSVVLPTLAQCNAAASTPGCITVVPSLAACTANPTLPGCSSVLPSLAACTANPTLAGCRAVLPSLADCIASPSIAGCSGVLPTLAACVVNPTATGCASVLPSLAACVAAPTAQGCVVVLPSLPSCIANPTGPGCIAVLPPIAACTANPARAGCSVVLPTLSTCIALPVTAGCSAVLPTLAQCAAAPGRAGCEAVLPTASFCSTHPIDPACTPFNPPDSGDTGSGRLPVAINNVVNLLITTTGGTQPVGASSNGTIVDSIGMDSKAEGSKKDNPKLDEQTGAKNDYVAKKLYCN